MGLMGSLYAGVSGLTSNGTGIEVLGNNIANLNTIGYKVSRANFQDMLSQSIIGAAGFSQVGRGTQIMNIDNLMTQGTFQSTDVPSDMAIAGNGMFILKGRYNQSEGNFYSRACQFRLDSEGYLVNPHGLKLQGYLADEEGNVGNVLGDLNLTGQEVQPKETESVTIAANLQSTTPSSGNTFDPQANEPADYSTSITVYDSLGSSHNVEVHFLKTPTDNRWEWHARVKESEITNPPPANSGDEWVEIGSGTLGFTSDGKLDTEAVSTAVNVTFKGASAQTVGIDFGDAITTDSQGVRGTGENGVTQNSGDSSIKSQTQDGFAAGTLQDYGIDPNGLIVGTFSNGVIRNIGQIALAEFPATDKLSRVGGNMFTETSESGAALPGKAATGSKGAVYAGTLEQSNVDLAREFVNLIAYQKGFQSSSKTITTFDQLLSELINLKR